MGEGTVDSAGLHPHPARAARAVAAQPTWLLPWPQAQIHVRSGTGRSGPKLRNGADGNTPAPVIHTATYRTVLEKYYSSYLPKGYEVVRFEETN